MNEQEIVQEENNVTDNTTAQQSVSEEDLFSQVFGDNSAEFVATDDNAEITEQTEENPLEVPSNTNQKNDTEQFQYWQSQADKSKAEVEVLKEQMSEMMSKLSKPAEVEGPKEIVVEKPIKPKKPSGFDHSDALNDPDSESAKYLAAKDDYIENLSDYMISIEDKRSIEVAKQQAEQKELLQQQKLRADLQSNYNYTNQQASDFIDKMSSPESLSLDNLVRLHQLDLTGSTQQIQQVTPEAQVKQNTMVQRGDKLGIPKTIGITPGAERQSSKKSTEDGMMDSMISDYTKKNPFL